MSTASAHDSRKLADVLDRGNTSSGVWADSAFHSQAIAAELAERGLKSHIHRRGCRNKPLTPRQQVACNTRSSA